MSAPRPRIIAYALAILALVGCETQPEVTTEGSEETDAQEFDRDALLERALAGGEISDAEWEFLSFVKRPCSAPQENAPPITISLRGGDVVVEPDPMIVCARTNGRPTIVAWQRDLASVDSFVISWKIAGDTPVFPFGDLRSGPSAAVPAVVFGTGWFPYMVTAYAGGVSNPLDPGAVFLPD